jgi:hypothetical protein
MASQKSWLESEMKNDEQKILDVVGALAAQTSQRSALRGTAKEEVEGRGHVSLQDPTPDAPYS